jgi:hypothetical protein
MTSFMIPSSGLIFFDVGLGLTCKTLGGMSFVKWGGEQELDANREANEKDFQFVYCSFTISKLTLF